MSKQPRMLGIGFSAKGFTQSKFFGSTNIHEYDVIVVPVSIIRDECEARGVKKSTPTESIIYDAVSKALKQTLDRLNQWAEEGNVLIFITDADCRFSKSMARGGVEGIHISSLPAFGPIRMLPATGNRVEYCGSARLQELKPLAPKLKYSYIIEGKSHQALFRVSTNRPEKQQIVGAFKTVGGGAIAYMPPLNALTSNDRDGYYEAIGSIYEKLLTPGEFERPSWVVEYVTSSEQNQHNELATLEAEAASLATRITAKKEDLEIEQQSKRLFYSSGDTLVEAVISGLQELGLKATTGPHPRADVLALDGKTVFAIEVKGVDGTGREIHIRQAEKWAAELGVAIAASEEDLTGDKELRDYCDCLDRLGIQADERGHLDLKALAIIGTFRNTSIDERKDSGFPDPLIRSAKRGNVCAVSGIELYAILEWSKGSDERKREIIELLKTTSGLLEKADWRKLLTKLRPEDVVNSKGQELSSEREQS